MDLGIYLHSAVVSVGIITTNNNGNKKNANCFEVTLILKCKGLRTHLIMKSILQNKMYSSVQVAEAVAGHANKVSPSRSTYILTYSLVIDNGPLANLTLYPIPMFNFIVLFPIRLNETIKCVY